MKQLFIFCLIAFLGLTTVNAQYVMPTNLTGSSPSGIAWSTVATGTSLPIRSSTLSANGLPGAVAYYDQTTGELLLDPKGLDISVLCFTYNPNTINVVLGTSGPLVFSCGYPTNSFGYTPVCGSGSNGNISSNTGTKGNIPAGIWTTLSTYPARIYATLQNPSMTTSGNAANIASTNGWFNLPWSFGHIIKQDSLNVITQANWTVVPGAIGVGPATANVNILGYGNFRGLFFYIINGVLGTQVGPIIPFNSCVATSDTLTVSACNSYTWAAKNNTVYTSSNNTDTIHLTNAGGCDSIVTLNLTINHSTTSTTNTTICASALPYTWNGLTFNAAGSQTYHTNNAAGCDSAATLNLTVNPLTTSTTNTTICASALPFTWNGLTFNAAGSQTYHTNNAVGCDSAATLNLSVNPLPTINAGADKLICPGASTSLTATGAVSYSWSGGITNGTSFSPSATTTYVVTGTNANNCTNTDTVVVTIRDFNVASITTAICKGVSDTLTAPSGSSYQWKKNGAAIAGKTTRYLYVTLAGSYTVTYTDSLCGVKTSPAIVLSLATPPVKPVLAATKAIICPGDTTTLFAVTTAYKYIWLLGSTTTILPGVTSQSYHTATIGSYYIKAVDSFGCRSAVSGAKVIKASVVPIPAMTVANGTLGSKKLTCTNNSGTYQWRLNGSSITGATAKTYTATQSGSYSVRFTNGAGCAATTADTTLTINYTGPKMSQEALASMNNQEDIKVYPNPSSDIFFIEASEATKAIVTDLQGRKVLETTNTHQVDLSNNPSGIYFLQLMNEEGMLLKTEKIIKQ